MNSHDELILDDIWPFIRRRTEIIIERDQLALRGVMGNSMQEITTSQTAIVRARVEVDFYAAQLDDHITGRLRNLHHFALCDVVENRNMVRDSMIYDLKFNPDASRYLIEKYINDDRGYGAMPTKAVVPNRYLSEAIF